MNLQDYTNLSQIVGTLLAVLALGYTAYQVHVSSKINTAHFWLELRKMFAEHQIVHQKLRPGGEWDGQKKGPVAPEEWASVEAYMGLFEHCERMLANKLLDSETFQAIYAYRLQNIVANRVVVKAKLHLESRRWEDFSALLERLKIQVPSCKLTT